MSTPRARVGPTVALVGRPNVGKSTLFNRITRTRRSIVAPIAGTTRDTIAESAEWQGVRFRLVDTGGLFGASEDPLHLLVVEHGRKAIAEADLIVFIVDGREGPVAGDQEIAAALHERGKPVILAINKTDDRRARDHTFEFYRFGFEPIFEVSSEHGEGVGDLLDAVVEGIKGVHGAGRTADGDVEDEEVRVAIIGRPNVGKSSLVNRLLREERVIVSDVPGTTRDAVDTVLRWQKRTYRIVDTAGIRRPGKVGRSGQIESVSVIIARRAIERADVAVMLLDSVEGATDQDGAIAGEAERTGCGVIIAANKWDLMKSRGADYSKTFDDEVRRQLKFLEYAPLLHISALTGERAPKLLETIEKVAQARRKRVPTAELNRFLEAVTASHPVASPGKKEVRILYAAQTGVCPPQFVLFTNVATRLHFSYERFLVNRLRDAFGFLGTPIRLQVRRRKGRDS
jgi:GTP-binding protein